MVEPLVDADRMAPGSTHGRDGARCRPPKRRWLLVAAGLPAALGVLLVLTIAVRNGPGVTPDSVVYLSAARSLLDGEGYRGPDGEPYVAFPPLFPTLIALVSLGRVDLVDAAMTLVAVSFGIVIVTTGWIAGRITGSCAVAALAALAVLVSAPVLDAALHVWSELPFIAFSMLCLCALVPQVERMSPRRSVTATVSASLAALTRYAGVTLTLTQLVISTTRSGGPFKSRPGEAWAPLLGLIPLLLWLMRNLLVSGTLAGERHPASASFVENGQAAVEAMLRWSVPIDAPMRIRALVALIGGGALLMGFVPPALRGDEQVRRLLRICLPLTVYCLLSIAYLVVAASITALDPIDGRLIAPVLPAVIALLLSAAYRAGGRWLGGLGRSAAIGVLALWLAASVADTARMIRRVEADGIDGYAAHSWQASATLDLVQDALPSGALYSNDAFAIWYRTGREARLSPRRHPYRSPGTPVDDLSGVRETLESGREAYLVWFDAVPRDFLLSPPEIATILELEPIVRLDDGTVYRLR
jgi:hypothetical protein